MAASVLIRLLLEVKQYQTALRQATTSMQQATQRMSASAARGSRAMKKSTKSASGFAKAIDFLKKRVIVAGAFFAAFYQGLILLRQFVGSAVVELFNLDDALRRVQSITKESDASIAQLRDNLLDLAKQGKLFNQSAGEVADSMFSIAQAGFASSEALTLARLAAEGAAVGFTTAETTAQVLVAVLKAYDLPVSKARDVMDILFQTVDTGIITFEDLATGLGKVLSSASALDVPLEEVAAAIATMTLRGFTADQAMTSLGRIMQTFIRPSQRAKKAAAEFGIELTADKIASQGLITTMQEMFVATGGNVNKFAQLFDRIQSTRGAISLFSDDGALLSAVMEEMGFATADAGAMAKALEERSKSLKFQLGVLRSQALALVTDALEPIMSGLAGIIGWINQLLAGKFAFVNFFADVGAVVRGLVLAFVALKAQALVSFFLGIGRSIMMLGDTMRLTAMQSGVMKGAMVGLKGALQGLAPLLIFIAVVGLSKLTKAIDPLNGMMEALETHTAAAEAEFEQIKSLTEKGILTGAEAEARTLDGAYTDLTNVLLDMFAGLEDIEDAWFGAKAGLTDVLELFTGDFRTKTDEAFDALDEHLIASTERFRAMGGTGPDLDLLSQRLLALSEIQTDDRMVDIYTVAAAKTGEIAEGWLEIERKGVLAAAQVEGFAITAGDSVVTMDDIKDAIVRWQAPLKKAKDFMNDILGLTTQQDLLLRAAIEPIEDRIALRRLASANAISLQNEHATNLGATVESLREKEDPFILAQDEIINALKEQDRIDGDIIEKLEAEQGILEEQNETYAARTLLADQFDDTLREEELPLLTEALLLLEDGPEALGEWIAKEKEAGTVLRDEVLIALMDVLNNAENPDNKLIMATAAVLEDLGIVLDTVEEIAKDRTMRLRFDIGTRRTQSVGGSQHGIRNFMGGLMRVGEAGEELVRLPRGSDVIPHGNVARELGREAKSQGNMSATAEVNITTSLMKDFQELKATVLAAVDEKLDEAAARVGLTKPRYGTLGVGIPRI